MIDNETSETLAGIEILLIEHTWLTSFYPVRVEGEVIGIGIVVVDITERKADKLELHAHVGTRQATDSLEPPQTDQRTGADPSVRRPVPPHRGGADAGC